MENKENIQYEKVRFKNHPIVMFKFASIVSIFILNELFRMSRNVLSSRESIYEIIHRLDTTSVIGVTAVVIVLSIFFIVRGYLIYKNTEIIIGEKSIHYKKYGIFFKTEKESLLTHITNVNLNSNIFYKIIDVKNVLININSSETADENDYKMVLSKKEAEKLRDVINTRKKIQLEKEDRLKKSLKRMNNKENIINNLSENEKNEYDKLQNTEGEEKAIYIGNETDESKKIGKNISEKLENVEMHINKSKDTDVKRIKYESKNMEFTDKKRFFKRRFTGIEVVKSTLYEAGLSNIIEFAVVIILFIVLKKLLILFLLLEPIRNFYKSYNKVNGFSIERKGSRIKIHYGFIDKKDFDIDVENIIGIGTHQTLLSRMMKSSCVTIDQIGYGNSEDELNWGSLFIKDSEIEEYIKALIPEISLGDIPEIINGEKREIIKNNREHEIEKKEIGEGNPDKCEDYIVRPEKVLYYLIFKSAIIIESIGFLFYIYFRSTYIFLLAALMSFIIGSFIFYNKKICIKNDVIIFCEGIFSKDRKVVPYRKIESVTCKQSIFQKKMGVSSLIIYYRDYKHGKTSESTGIFEEGTFDNILEYYKNGEK